MLLDLKRLGLHTPPELALADAALGFRKAAGEVWPTTREQRCSVRKTANVLAKLPKSQQPKAKRALQEIWMAETKADAEAAFDALLEIAADVCDCGPARWGRRMAVLNGTWDGIGSWAA